MEQHTAKHFALQLGSLISLYLSLGFLLLLIFSSINLAFPDDIEGSWELISAVSSARVGIAFTIVFFPTYLVLTRVVNRLRRDAGSGAYLGLTKWLIYLSLLVGGGVLLGDLVAVILAFLEGEITIRFILKALAVLIVIGAAFYYYLLDARGYWLIHERSSVQFGVIVTILVLSAIVGSFQFTETPSEARERALDEEQVNDLRTLQWRIEEYLAINGTLPEDSTAFPAGSDFDAPENRPDYTYQKTDVGFTLCATFKTESLPDEFAFARPMIPSETAQPTIINPENWQHGVGDVCFERIVR